MSSKKKNKSKSFPIFNTEVSNNNNNNNDNENNNNSQNNNIILNKKIKGKLSFDKNSSTKQNNENSNKKSPKSSSSSHSPKNVFRKKINNDGNDKNNNSSTIDNESSTSTTTTTIPQRIIEPRISKIALFLNALVFMTIAVALYLQPRQSMAWYQGNDFLQLNQIALHQTRFLSSILFFVAVVNFVLIGVRDNESCASVCYAMSYAFLFAVATFSTSLYADYGSFWKGLQSQPYDVDKVLWIRVYIPLTLAMFNLIAGYYDDIDDRSATPVKSKTD